MFCQKGFDRNSSSFVNLHFTNFPKRTLLVDMKLYICIIGLNRASKKYYTVGVFAVHVRAKAVSIQSKKDDKDKENDTIKYYT